jgi:hypothetical protein
VPVTKSGAEAGIQPAVTATKNVAPSTSPDMVI